MRMFRIALVTIFGFALSAVETTASNTRVGSSPASVITREHVQRLLGDRRLEILEDEHMVKKGAPLSFQFRVDGENKLEANGKIFDLDDAVPYNLGPTTCVHDGVTDSSCEDSLVRVGKNEDGDTFIVLVDAETGDIIEVTILFANGDTIELVNLDPNTGLFVTITMDDYDPEKAEEFINAMLADDSLNQGTPIPLPGFEDPQDDGANRRKLDASEPSSTKKTTPRHIDYLRGERSSSGAARDLQNRPPCTTFDILEVAIAYDSTFCDFYGGNSQTADAKVQEIMAYVSARYEQNGMCIRVVLVELESHCSSNNDPYAAMVALNDSGCGGGFGMLQAFRDLWNSQRSSVHRDVAHLFSGSPLECQGNSCVVGCASVGVWCNLGSSYGVNHVTAGSSITFQGLLVAHELGHNGGANHFDGEVGRYIMYPSTNGGGTEWSTASINAIRNRVDSTECLAGCSTDADCVDNDLCAGDATCDIPTGVCIYGPGTSCDNNMFCDGVETCNPATGQCVSQTLAGPNVCNDGVACNGEESCSEGQDECSPGEWECDSVSVNIGGTGPINFDLRGYFFDLSATEYSDVQLISIQVTPFDNGQLRVYTRQSSANGNTSSGNGWNRVLTVQTAGDGPETLTFDEPITIEAGTTLGVHVYGDAGVIPTFYTGKEFFQRNDVYSTFDLDISHGLAVPGFFGNSYYSSTVDLNNMVITYTVEGASNPVPDPTPAPTKAPVPAPTPSPTEEPVPDPTPAPTKEPVSDPTPAPVPDPTPSPTEEPVSQPSPSPPTGGGGNCGNNQNSVRVTITTDNWPGEISWNILRGITVIESGGQYSERDTTYEETFCVESGFLYVFQIFDTYGDGIVSPGGFEVQFDEEIFGGSGFGRYFKEVMGSCGNGRERLAIALRTDRFGGETSFTITDSNSDYEMELPDDTLGNRNDYELLDCIEPSGCYEFTINDSYGDGMCCSQGSGGYEVNFNGEVVAQGGNFQFSESEEFGDGC